MMDLKQHELKGYATIKRVLVSEAAKRLSIPVSTMYYRLKHNMRAHEIRAFIRAVDEIAAEKWNDYEVCRIENVPELGCSVLEVVQWARLGDEHTCKDCVSFTGEHENGWCECFRKRGFDFSHTCKNCEFFYKHEKCVYNMKPDDNGECKEFDADGLAYFNGMRLEYGLDHAIECHE